MLFGFLVIRVNSFWGILLNAQATVVVMVNRIHSPMLFSMCCVVTGGKCIQCVCPSVRLDALYANANNQPSIVNVFFCLRDTMPENSICPRFFIHSFAVCPHIQLH